ncbi:MAG: STAS domain-containing protein [Candidatus Nanopelagicales bacterium]
MDLEVSVDQLDDTSAAGDAPGIPVVKVVGEVDVASVPLLDQELGALAKAGKNKIIVDFSGVSFIDSTGLGVVVKALKNAREAQGWVRVVAQEDRVTKVFAITGLDAEFALSETIEEAAAR